MKLCAHKPTASSHHPGSWIPTVGLSRKGILTGEIISPAQGYTANLGHQFCSSQWSVELQDTNLELQCLKFKSWLCHRLAVGPYTSGLVFQFLLPNI